MLFGGAKDSRRPHLTGIVRDVVEVVAIIAAGIWAFYVFAYENRIKPSLADPDVNITASMARLGEHNGLIAVGMHLELHNVGTVKATFLGACRVMFVFGFGAEFCSKTRRDEGAKP